MRLSSILAAAAVAFLAAASSAEERQADFSAVRLPLAKQTHWQLLQYGNLPPHRVRFSEAGLEVMVDGSAMPIIYPLPAQLRVNGIRVRGRDDTGSKFTVLVKEIELQRR